MAAERGLDDGLCRDIRADAHVRQHVQSLDVVLRNLLVAAEHHPADAVSGNHV